MGILPTYCEACGEYYCAVNSPHCVDAEQRLKNAKERQEKYCELIDAIILAYRKRGECRQEILNAAYEFGYSVSKEEFEWLDEVIEKYRLQGKNDDTKQDS